MYNLGGVQLEGVGPFHRTDHGIPEAIPGVIQPDFALFLVAQHPVNNTVAFTAEKGVTSNLEPR